MKLFFDESGQTGTHLLDANQPNFVLASTSVPENEAHDLITRCFPNAQSTELKANRLLTRPKGRRRFLAFAEAIAPHSQSFCVVKISKRFTVISKLVDFLVEPLISSLGYDFYRGDYARKFANLTSFIFDQILDRSVTDPVLRTYNQFARSPDRAKLAQLQNVLRTTRNACGPESQWVLDFILLGALNFESLHNLDVFRDTNDIHVTAVMQSMAHWQSVDDGPFEVVHDESIHFFSRNENWGMLTNSNVEPQTLGLGTRRLTLPLPVASTTSAKSHENASLQLCDLVAGFVAKSSILPLDPDFRLFSQDVIAAGVGEIPMFPVDADFDLADGPPERADGPDIIDQMMAALGAS